MMRHWMVKQWIGKWSWRLLVLGMSGYAFQAGCLRVVQQEMDLLFAPEANLGWIHQSVLVDVFGPSILKFW